MPLDCLRTLVPLMVHCHTVCQDAQTSGMGPTLGPYFPKRSSHHHGNNNTITTMKPAVRPPKPMLQMAFPHLGQETAKVQTKLINNEIKLVIIQLTAIGFVCLIFY